MKSNPNDISRRFTGKSGRKNLITALASQIVVSNNNHIACKLAKSAKVLTFRRGKKLMSQGDGDTDIYFILAGKVNIEINGRVIAERGHGEHVGEMALIETNAVRSATVRSVEKTVIAKVEESDFTKIAKAHPNLWRKIASQLAQRLRERSEKIKAPNDEPVIFIGSSSEAVSVADTISRKLSKFRLRPWNKNVFNPSKGTLEDLVNLTQEVDYAVIVLTPDDITRSRGVTKSSPRDNAIFELGLFMGAISRERTYFLYPSGVKIKIPSDLIGVTGLEYVFSNRRKILSRNMANPCKRIKQLIVEQGAR